ncbi:MAG: tetratricopeptide repeat protein [Bacteroidetes bacterium]|nr:tetratricopeptide repeat protein [Bacteroidota bacterium]MBI3482933.1 tetratricopeptide repeat protein [Bacteroidota bacterium]
MLAKRIYVFFLILTLYTRVSHAQVDQVDLEKKLQQQLHDTAYVNALNELAILAFSAHPEKTLTYAATAKKIADSLRYDKGVADSYFASSLISKLKGNYNDELDFHLRSLKIYQSLNNLNRIARTYDAMGALYTQEADFQSAREVHMKAIELFKKTNDRLGLASSLRRIGNIELDTRNFGTALQYYRQALENERTMNNEQGIANCLNNIGVVYFELKKYDSALVYHNESLAIMTRINFVSRLPAAYHNISRVYLGKGRPDEALPFAEKGLPIALRIGSRPAQRESYKLHSDIYQKKGDYTEAYRYLLLYNALKDSIINQENNLHFAQRQSIYKVQEKEQEIELLKKDQQLARFTQQVTITGLVFFISIGGYVIYLQWKRIREKKKSYELVQQHGEFVHQVNEELKANLEEIEAKNKEISEMASHLQQVNSTKDKLFSVISHDLKNPIHSLQGLLSLLTADAISKEEFLQFSAKLKEGVGHFEFTLHNLLQWAQSQMQGIETNPQRVTLHALVDSTLKFLAKIAADKNILLYNEVMPHAHVLADKDQLDLVIRNLVTNAIKFTKSGGKVTISCTNATDHLAVISVVDTGIGMNQETVDKLFKKNVHFRTAGTRGEHGSGLGLMLCHEMAVRNQGKLWVESKPDQGTTFFIELPLA